jgi:acetoin utilization protein AcuC
MNTVEMAVIAHDDCFLSYDFGPEHPLRPERLVLGLDLLREAGIWDESSESLAVIPATDQELQRVHDAGYLRAVQDAGMGLVPLAQLARFGLGAGDTPAFTCMHEATSLVAGGTLAAARAVMRGEVTHAFNPAGGLHHALRARASGFCVYNDPAVAAAALVEEFHARVLSVDFDCHHGDGVQWLFYDDPRVMTVSFHETGRHLFPGTGGTEEIGEGAGRGFAVNVPFAPFTQDDSWLEAIRTVLIPLAESFKPDIILSNHGADTHIRDPLTHLSLTTRAFMEQARLTHELAHALAEGRWLAVGSGGYEWRAVVPRSWAILWSEMTNRRLPNSLPTTWLDRWNHTKDGGLPRSYADDAELQLASPMKQEIDRLNRRTVAAARDILVLPWSA